MDLVQVILHNIYSFVVILSVIVFIHEFGHYYIAKKCGVHIEVFSIGFGKEIFGLTDKSGTRWKFSLIPLGGYVKMFGDHDPASTPDTEKLKEMGGDDRNRAFFYKPVWQRFLIVLGGPLANFVLAVVILFGFFANYGRPETLPVIDAIVSESAAFEAGMQIGDKIIELDGTSISRFEDLKTVATIHPDMKISYKIIRDGQEIEGFVTPKKVVIKDDFGNDVEIGLLGISSNNVEYKELGLFESFTASISETYTLSARTLEAIGQIITGQRNSDQVSGIIRIADYSGKSMEQGFRMVLWLMAVLSINLGLINLFPVPMLDGGHLVFYIYEAIIGKPLPEKLQEYFFRFGFLLLIFLMLFATFNDLKHFNIISF